MRAQVGRPRDLVGDTRAGLELWAADTLALLGLHCLHQERGANWKASDDQIAEFLRRFHGDGPG